MNIILFLISLSEKPVPKKKPQTRNNKLKNQGQNTNEDKLNSLLGLTSARAGENG